MAEQKEHGITWTDATWNPIRGCSRVSEGCRNCYAERTAFRHSAPGMAYEGLVRVNHVGIRRPEWNGTVRVVEEHMLDPLRWRRPRRIFVNSMSDLFHPNVADETIDRIFAVMALCPQHSFQVLTKRPERMLRYLSERTTARVFRDFAMTEHEFAIAERLRKKIIELFEVAPAESLNRASEALEELYPSGEGFMRAFPLPNVWLGVSVEHQAAADERIPLLLQTPAAVRWISAEPLLGPIDLTVLPREASDFDRSMPGFDRCKGFYADALAGSNGVLMKDGTCHEEPVGAQPRLDWVVVGGESGPGARPMHPDWARSLRDQCVAAKVAFHFKQWGEWQPAMTDGAETERGIELNCSDDPVRVGKRAAGRELDGRTWDEYPAVRAC